MEGSLVSQLEVHDQVSGLLALLGLPELHVLAEGEAVSVALGERKEDDLCELDRQSIDKKG